MFNSFLKPALMLLCLGISQIASAQYATEIMIPIGQSPGVSGKHTVLGNVTSVDTQTGVVTIEETTGSHQAKISGNTPVFLDRSQLRQSNREASIADIGEGMRVEVKYVNNDRGAAVEWIKVQAAQ